MVMIVAHHFSVHGKFDFIEDISFNKALIQFLRLGGKIGVNVFVLISGYFLIKEENLKLKKIIKLWLQVFFYSILFYFLFILFGENTFSIKSMLKACCPIIFRKYWFASAYFILYLYIPYINKFASMLDANSYKKLLFMMFCCWSFIPTFTKQGMYLNYLIWFLFLYLLAGYIRLHPSRKKKECKKYFIWTTILYIGTFSITLLLDVLMNYWSKLGSYTVYLYSMEKLPILFISIFLLLGFKNLKMKNNKKINVIASAAFGVYLIHDNEFMRAFLWNKNNLYATSKSLLLYAILAIVIVYIVSSVIELIRIYTVEKVSMKFLDKNMEHLEKMKTKVLKKLKLH